MDLDIIRSTKEGEITQFLCDVRDYFKASLATSEYENTSNMFYLTASEATEVLLNRCECLLNRLNSQLPINTSPPNANKCPPTQNDPAKNHQWVSGGRENDVQHSKDAVNNEEVSYLDMSAPHYDNEKRKTLNGKVGDLNAFRCSTLVVKQNKSFLHRLHDTITTTATKTADQASAGEEIKENQDEAKTNSFEDDTQIYDICQVTTQESDGEEDDTGLEETQKVIAQDCQVSLPSIDCPYADLPAGHLPIKKSIKYGQLLKIEKRLFFDQSKKCYCGILNDWLLCYAEGPTSSSPTVSLYLKIPGIEIEHFGEGKRREVCFQITTCDPNKRFVFQAVNEIDAKEWIHAIEAAIRNDISCVEAKNSSTRKLPTPPVMKRITFLNSSNTTYDGIYEEPSPISQVTAKGPKLPTKQSNPSELDQQFEYDVPKSPPQPFKNNLESDVVLINPYENNNTGAREQKHSNTLSGAPSLPPAQKLNLKMDECLDFQAKVKDVHSKLTSQLSSGPITKSCFKKSNSCTMQNNTENLSLPLPTSPLPEVLEVKKQKKSPNPSTSQKISTEKSSFAKNWFLNRLNKTTSSSRSNSTSPSTSPSKCKQSEKENLLNSSSEGCDGYDPHTSNSNSNPVSSALKTSPPNSGKSKVNMIINKLEASGHLASMFNLDAVTSFNAFSDNDFNNYEPIMTVSSAPTNLMKKI